METRLQMIVQLFGGLALFLYGMENMSGALQQAAGQKLRSFLQRLTGTPLAGAAAGAAVTALLQSSSAVTVMLVGFVSAGLLDLSHAVPVVFGANIGTTITAQLLAFRLEDARYFVLFAGVALCFLCREGRVHSMGEAVFGFGLLFEGIAVMGTAMEPLAHSPMFAAWMVRVRHKPLLGLLAGLCMTLTVQSSSATVAILQDLAARPGPDGVHSVLGLAGALPVLLGDNIGTTITAVLAAWGGTRDAKRVAAAHACFNISGAVLFTLGLPWYVRAVEWLSPAGAECGIIARQIANAHTLFNVVCTLLWLPLTPVMTALVRHLVPEKP